MRRYRNLLNPLTIFCVMDIGIYTIASGISAVAVNPLVANSPDSVVATCLLAIVYILGATVVHLPNRFPPERLYARALHFLTLDTPGVGDRFSRPKFVFILFAAVLALGAVAVLGGGGILWLTDPRTAYVQFREGLIAFFALNEWLLTFSLLYYLWARRPRGARMIGVLLLHCFFAYFSGSKGNFLYLIVITLFYYHFLVKPIPTPVFAGLALLMVGSSFVLLILQGTIAETTEAGFYFQGYFATTEQFLARFDEFGFRYGSGYLSQLWFFAPRALFPNKPYEFGSTLLHEVLYPGSAAQGITVGYLPWSLTYMDFGVLGVFLEGMLRATLQRMAYEHYRLHRSRFFAFMLMILVSLLAIYIFAPLIFVVVIAVAQCVFLRLRFARSRRTLAETSPG
jgi:hypothetical protein